MISPSRPASPAEPLEARIAPAAITVAGTMLTFTAGAGVDNSVTLDYDSTTHIYSFAEPGEIITIDAGAIALGFSVSVDAHTVNGPEAGLTGLTFNLGDGSDGIEVKAAGAQALSLNGGEGDDFFFIDGTRLAPQPLANAIVIDAGSGTGDGIEFDDISNVAGAFFNIDASAIDRPGGRGVQFGNAEFVSVQGGSGADTINVSAVPAGIEFDLGGNGGGNVFNVGGPARTLAPILGTLVLTGGSGVDQFVFDDSASATLGSAVLSAGSLTVDGVHLLNFGGQAGDSVAVKLRGTSASELTINSLAAGVAYTLTAGTNGSQFSFGGSAHSLAGILGHASVVGGGNSTATIDDSSAFVDRSFHLDAATFSQDARELFSFTELKAFTLKTGAGSDRIDAAAGTTRVDIDSGEGDDDLRIAPRAATVNTGDGGDVLTITGIAGDVVVGPGGLTGTAFGSGLVFPSSAPELIRLSGNGSANHFTVGAVDAFVMIDGGGGRDSIIGSDVLFAGKTVSFLDAAGSRVTIATDKGRFGLENLELRPEGRGATLLRLDLTHGAKSFARANLAITAKATSGGDGFAAVGQILANNIDLASVRVRGDLAAIIVGDGDTRTAALGKLTAQSLGVLGGAALPAGVFPGFDFRGSVGRVDVTTDFARGLLSATGLELGKIGRITIGGDFAAHIYATGRIGAVKIGSMSNDSSITADFGANIGSIAIRHGVRNADIFAGGVIGSVNVGGSFIGSSLIASGRSTPKNATASIALPTVNVRGSVRDSFIGAGYDLAGTAVNADAAIGAVTIRGNFQTSDIAAGIDSGDSVYGNGNDQVATPPDGPFSGVLRGDPAIVARIARVVIGGSVIGEPIPTGEHHAIIAESIGRVIVGGVAVPRVENGGEFVLGLNGDVSVADPG